jgi:ABC-type uncharacterized transport system auxiliary subunit
MKKSIILILFAIVLLAGCRSSKTVEPSFYLLDFPNDKQVLRPDSIIDISLPTQVTIEIEDIDINPVFSTNKIALREKTHTVRYFTNHLWAIRPDQSFTRFLLRYYEKNKVFKNIDTRFWKIPVDYKLNTTIHRLEVIQLNKNQFSAHLLVEFNLQKTSNEQIVLKYTGDKSQILAKKDLNLFAKAICDIFFDELQAFTQQAAVVVVNSK